MEYNELLQVTNLPTLASRRQYLKMCIVYQLVSELISIPGISLGRRNLTLNLHNANPYQHTRATLSTSPSNMVREAESMEVQQLE